MASREQLIDLLRDVKKTFSPLLVGYGPHRDLMEKVTRVLEEEL